jgi:hypothetical protein
MKKVIKIACLLVCLLLFAVGARAQSKARMLAAVNAQSCSTPHTFAPTDVLYLTTFNSGSACTATLQSASTTGFGAGSIFSVKNNGAGTVTIMVSSGTIDGSSSISLSSGQDADIYSDGTNYTSQRGAGTSSGGRGCTPAGTTNPLQKNNGVGGCTSTAISDTGSAVNVDEDLHPKGPNPYYDLTRFGLYVGAGIPITCSITAGNNVARCPAGVGDFAVGQGVAFNLAGLSPAFNAWGVTSISAFSRTSNVARYTYLGPMLGTGQTVTIAGISDSSFNGTFTIASNDGDAGHFFVNNSGSKVSNTSSTGTATLTSPNVVVTPQGIVHGSTTCAYKIVQRSYSGAFGVASPAGTTTTCAATLGPNTVNVTSSSRTNGLVTVVTSSAHNFQPGVEVDLEGTANNQYNGVHMIFSTPTSTTFTFVQASVPDNAGNTGGTAKVVAKNLVQWPMTQYKVLQSLVYRSINGRGYSLVAVVEGMDGAFVDWGLSAPAVPSYFPTTPPRRTTNGILATTITAVDAVAKTLTLAANASNTATSQLVQHDNAPIVLNACQALPSPGGGELYIPATNPNANVAFNSILDLYDFCPTVQMTLTYATNIIANEPMIMKQVGQTVNAALGSSMPGNQFLNYFSATIGGIAYPFFYVVPGSFGPMSFQNLTLNCNQPYQSCILLDQDGGGGGVAGIHFDNIAVSGSAGAMPFIMRSGGFNFWFKDSQFQVSGGAWGVPEALQINTPNALGGAGNGGQAWDIAGIIEFNKTVFTGHGIEYNDWGNNNVQGIIGHVTFIEPIIESPWGPWLSVFLTGANSGFSDSEFHNASYSDFLSGPATPFILFSSNAIRVNGLLSYFSACGSSNQPLFEGFVTGGVEIWNGSTAGCSLLGTPVAKVHNLATGFAGATEDDYLGVNTRFSNGGKSYYAMDIPAAPSVAVVAGGLVPVGVQCYAIFAYDPDGGTTTDGPATCVTTTTGNQTVNITRPTLPGNAVAWNIKWNGGSYLLCSPIPVATIVKNFPNAAGCGNSFNQNNTAGKANLGPHGISGLQFTTNQMDVIDTVVSNPSALFGRVSYHANSLQCTNSDGSTCLPGTGTTITVCSGSQALGTSAIASGAAASTVTITCTGLLATDNIMLDFNGSPLAVTGYVPSSSGMLTILKWPTANTINVSVVNSTASSITPGAITLNYRVVR